MAIAGITSGCRGGCDQMEILPTNVVRTFVGRISYQTNWKLGVCDGADKWPNYRDRKKSHHTGEKRHQKRKTSYVIAQTQ